MNTNSDQRRRMSRKRMVLALVAAPALALVAAGTASATTIDSPTGSPVVIDEDGDTITVSGTGVEGNYVLVALCNLNLDDETAGYCRQFVDEVDQVDGNGEWSVQIEVPVSFTNYSLISGTPSGGTTNCLGNDFPSGAQCGIQASEYEDFPPMGPPVDTPQTVEVEFSGT